jgi:hypothetical protein
VDHVHLEYGFDVVQVIVGFYCGVVAAEDMDLGPVDTAYFEFLFDAVEIVQIFGYIKMPFHAFIPRVNELQPEYARRRDESRRRKAAISAVSAIIKDPVKEF